VTRARPGDRPAGGLDGCRGGWVLATARPAGPPAVELVGSFAEALARVEAGRLGALAVDIPIGLPAAGPRACDRAARLRLGPRRSSVFPAPVRPVLAAAGYAEALALARRVDGRGLSRQAFGLLAKIAEVDALVTPARQARIVEAHPEVCFAALTGHPMRHPKRLPAGRAEREVALAGVFPGFRAAPTPPGASPDDVLDACVLVWTARRHLAGAAEVLGDGRRDPRGLRMEIVA
jgi:predicted RNase H-like nuclease